MSTRKQPEPENHERWLISYADFVTLLFAFFVVLFASSTMDESKMQTFAASFESFVTHDEVSSGAYPAGHSGGFAVTPPQGTTVRDALTVAELRPAIERLEDELLPEIRQGKIELSLQARGLVMSLRESGFFAPGEAELQPQSLGIMSKVAKALTRIPGQIRLEGHTDNTPIYTRKYPSNWELSTARAITVLKLLVDVYKIPTGRLAAAGHGEFFPLVPNDTPENRAKNRRVDVVVLTKEAAAMEPKAKRGGGPQSTGPLDLAE